jgi:hypothetical protein
LSNCRTQRQQSYQTGDVNSTFVTLAHILVLLEFLNWD